MAGSSSKYTNIELTNIWKTLKSKIGRVQEEASHKLFEYLQKHPEETDEIFKEFHTGLQSPNKQDKLGIFLALNKILDISHETQIIMYVNKLIPDVRQQLETNNVSQEIVEKGAECLGNLARSGGNITVKNIDDTLERAIELLKSNNRPNNTDIKKYSAVLILKEFSQKLPLITFNKLFSLVNKPYLQVFEACKDNRQFVREAAAEVINACIKHISDRQQRKGQSREKTAKQSEETKKEKETETSMIYTEVKKAYEKDASKEYKQSALSILGELISQEGTSEEIIKIMNQGEQIVNEVQKMLKESTEILVKKKCIDLIPSMYRYIPDYYKSPDRLSQAIKDITNYIEKTKGKDRGQGYISLGRLSVRATEKDFAPHIATIVTLVYKEIQPPIRQRDGTIKPNVELDALTCFTYLLKHHGSKIDECISIPHFISDLFLSGFKNEVIQCLGQISRIKNGKYKRHCQIKLLNSCSIILTQKVDRFPYHLEEQFQVPSQMPGGDNNRQTSTARGRPRGESDESDRPVGNFGGNLNTDTIIIPRDSELMDSVQDPNFARGTNNGMSMSLQPRDPVQYHKQHLKALSDFYSEILNKQNQAFLEELIKQASLPQTEENKQQEEMANERTQMVTLALKTLSIFDFQEYAMCIVYFIERSVLNFLDDENPQIRKLAMQTCCTLHLPSTNQLQISSNIKRIINKLLHRFFVTATTDNENRIRVTMLKHLNSQFDPFISRYENLLMLFNCMQDQNFEIREWTVRILGRLVPHNASQILPYLRQLIVSLISQLEQSNDAREREEAVKLIKMFVRYTPDLAKAYSTSILLCLIKKLDGERATSTFVSAILNVISEISKINAEAIKPYLGDLFPLILECIKDMTSSTKRKEAVRTLISIIENTSFVVKPYFYFPQLLEVIENLVQTEQNADIKKHILRLIGTLGAVDPYLIKQINRSQELSGDMQDAQEFLSGLPLIFQLDENDSGMRKIKDVDSRKRQLIKAMRDNQGTRDMNYTSNTARTNSMIRRQFRSIDTAKNNNDEKTSEIQIQQKPKTRPLITVEELNLSKEHKYPAMAIHALMRVLIDPNMRDHHLVTLNGLTYILRCQNDCMPYIPMIIPPLMDLIKQNDAYRTQDLFGIVSLIVRELPDAVLKFADHIFEMIHLMIHIQPKYVLKLLQEINKPELKQKLFSHMYLILPEVLTLIEQSRKHADLLAEQNLTRSNDLILLTQEAMRILPSFEIMILDDHLYLIIPLLLRTASCGRNSIEINNMQKIAIQMMNLMVVCSTFREFTAQVIHQLLKLLEVQSTESELISFILESFATIAKKLQTDFAPYIQLIMKAVKRNGISQRIGVLEDAILRITKQDPIERFRENLEQQSLESLGFQEVDETHALPTLDKQKSDMAQQKLNRTEVNTAELLLEFDTSKCHIADDWTEWLKKTSHQLLKQNPSPVLFACASLTEMYAPLATELYNIAFVSCWRHMQDDEKQKIMEAFTAAHKSKTHTTQVLQQILNLAEFMELDEISDIMFGSKTLAEIAKRCNTLAKALYYWEKEFENSPTETIKLLIETNHDLQQPEAAKGILKFGENNKLVQDDDLEIKEKSQEWQELLKLISQSDIQPGQKIINQNRKINCYNKLMNWQQLSDLVGEIWSGYHEEVDPRQKNAVREQIKEVASVATYAAWNLQDWDRFKRFTKQLDKHPYEKYFFNAVLEIKFPSKPGNYEAALKYIDNARTHLDTKITSLLGESYNRAYKQIQELQFLTELEEVIHYKATKSEEKKASLYACWLQRQKCIPTQDLDAHQKLLNIRCLVIDKKEEIDNYIDFAKMAQDNHNTELSSRILLELREELKMSQELLIKDIAEKKDAHFSEFTLAEQQAKINTKRAKVELAIYDAAYTNNINNSQNQEQATYQLEELIKKYTDIEPALLSTCYVKLGSWQIETLQSNKGAMFNQLDYSKVTENYEQIVSNCRKATEIDPSNAEAWHYYSYTNEEACIYYSKQFSLEHGSKQMQQKDKEKEYLLHRQFGTSRLPKLREHPLASKYIHHLLASVTGLIKQLEISSMVNKSSATGTKTLQTTLRLLKIWFQHGNLPEIQSILKEGVERIDLKVWIEVIPQLLARIDIKDEIIRKTLIELVEKISLKFPQAILYSLSVQENSTSNDRKRAAKQLLEKLKTTQRTLIDQATSISTEMNRSAIVLSEMWQEAIEEASRIYFGRQDGQAMYNYLAPIHKEMEREPDTMNEIAFYQGYASDLLDAFSWMKLYMRSKRTADINQAWDIYYSIFRRISTKQKDVTFYELRNVAPKLLTSENLDIAVPGTFKSNKPIVKIAKFASILPVLPSKQHPRKMSVYGSDGREYLLLLKGHEDIRQDERVMQLFGLVNTLLQIDRQTSKKDLGIRRYPVIPLSQNTGLIGWVPGCDTLHILIKEHRAENNIIPNIDYKLMEKMCEHFEICPLPNKVEIFRNALEKTAGEDLQKVLWVKSQNSEVWLERRTNYTRSLAVMSMVGYILGLGDRHPSNIMLERSTGKIVHIDFGDCFEIAMRREKFPEKIPFRLTRMLTKAMEVSGIEGNFRTTCENTMKVMRENKESLLAIMEAFVYDPLISFRLMNPKLFKGHKEEGNNGGVALEGAANKVVAQQPVIQDLLDSQDVMAKIDENKAAQIRGQIVDQVLERIQGTQKGTMLGKNYAESRFSRHVEDMELMRLMKTEEEEIQQKQLNQIAEVVIERIQDKLRGLEFTSLNTIKTEEDNRLKLKQKKEVEEQVDILIKQATNHENLASCYIGWCPYW